MDDKVVYIVKNKIKPVFSEDIFKTDVTRFKKLIKDFTLFDKIIPVERDPYKDQYYVVGRYPTFEILYSENDLVPCIIEPFSNKKEQLIKIARRFIYQSPTPSTKQRIIDKLYINKMNKEEIINSTSFNREQLNRYNYHNTVPTKIKNTNEDHGRPIRIATVNQINSLQRRFPEQFTDDITDHLYDEARKGSLTQEQLKVIYRMIRYTKGFELLTFIEKRSVITYVCDFRGVLIKIWQEKINTLLSN